MQNLEENNRFEIKNKTKDQGQSIPKSIGILTVLRCICEPNFGILTSIGGDLSCRQSHKLKMGKTVNFKFNLNLKAMANRPIKAQES